MPDYTNKFMLMSRLGDLEDQIESAPPEIKPILEKKADTLERAIRGDDK